MSFKSTQENVVENPHFEFQENVLKNPARSEKNSYRWQKMFLKIHVLRPEIIFKDQVSKPEKISFLSLKKYLNLRGTRKFRRKIRD